MKNKPIQTLLTALREIRERDVEILTPEEVEEVLNSIVLTTIQVSKRSSQINIEKYDQIARDDLRNERSR
jgi:hypothetical protein